MSERPVGNRPGPPRGPPLMPVEDAQAVADEQVVEDSRREGLDVKVLSQWDLARRRFLRHKLAMASVVLLVLIFLAAIFAGFLTPYEFDQINLDDPGTGPTLAERHFFGTDQLGRDYFTRVLYGIRTTARVAFLVALLSVAIGTTIGALAGYYSGWVDNVLMRITDLILTLPYLPVLLVAAALLGRGSPNRVAVILAFLFWTYLARIVRGTFLSLKQKEYVEAARAVGASDRRIILRHLLPNSIGPIIVNGTLTVANAILVEAFLSYLGFGIQPPTPALGALISDGQGQMLDLWWLVTFPGVAIVLICLCVNFIGDGLRDALDPAQRRVRV